MSNPEIITTRKCTGLKRALLLSAGILMVLGAAVIGSNISDNSGIPSQKTSIPTYDLYATSESLLSTVDALNLFYEQATQTATNMPVMTITQKPTDSAIIQPSPTFIPTITPSSTERPTRQPSLTLLPETTPTPTPTLNVLPTNTLEPSLIGPTEDDVSASVSLSSPISSAAEVGPGSSALKATNSLEVQPAAKTDKFCSAESRIELPENYSFNLFRHDCQFTSGEKIEGITKIKGTQRIFLAMWMHDNNFEQYEGQIEQLLTYVTPDERIPSLYEAIGQHISTDWAYESSGRKEVLAYIRNLLPDGVELHGDLMNGSSWMELADLPLLARAIEEWSQQHPQMRELLRKTDLYLTTGYTDTFMAIADFSGVNLHFIKHIEYNGDKIIFGSFNPLGTTTNYSFVLKLDADNFSELSINDSLAKIFRTVAYAETKTQFITVYSSNWQKLNDRNRLKYPEDTKSPIYEIISEQIPPEYTFVLPVNSELTQKFGVKNELYNNTGGIHTGVDLNNASQVIAPSNCRVIGTSNNYYLGKNILCMTNIMFEIGAQKVYLVYFFAHLKENVKPGTFSPQGSVLGTIGNTGALSTGPHLHFEIRLMNQNGVFFNKLNPELFMPERTQANRQIAMLKEPVSNENSRRKNLRPTKIVANKN